MGVFCPAAQAKQVREAHSIQLVGQKEGRGRLIRRTKSGMNINSREPCRFGNNALRSGTKVA